MECFVEGSVDDDVRVCHAGLSVNENDEVWYHSLMCDSFYCHRHLFKSMLNSQYLTSYYIDDTQWSANELSQIPHDIY